MKQQLYFLLHHPYRHYFIAGALIIISAFFRLWNLPASMQFLGDQGRDAMIVSRIFREGDFVLIGPVTSTGNMYLGPLYYYFMVPFLALTYPSPVGPAYAVAVISIITSALMYVLGRSMIGDRGALIAAVLFTFSHVSVNLARFSWNPNPAPLFGLLFLWFLHLTEQKRRWAWVGVSMSIAILIQLHYVTLLTVPVALFFWCKQQMWRIKNLPPTLLALSVFALSLLPLIAFDLRHNWLNVSSLVTFIQSSQDPIGAVPWSRRVAIIAAETHGRSMHLLFEMTIGKQRLLNTVLLLFTLLSGLALLRSRNNRHASSHIILAVTFVVAVIGLSLYRSSVFDHYVAFFLPTTFLIFGTLLSALSRRKVGAAIAVIAVVGYVVFNIQRMPLASLGWTISDIRRTAETVAERVRPGEKYNIVLLSETKDVYGENYRYYLTTSETPPLRIEQFGEVETLFIIDEQRIVPDVTALPIYEIVVFPNKSPSEVYQVPGGPTVTVLRRSL